MDSLQDSNIAPNLAIPFVAPCQLKHKDALSAVRRVKSERCRRLIINTACLSEAKKLHDLDMKRSCPVPRSKGSPAKWVDVSNTPYGPPIRIAYVLTVHGRAFRQVKRLFKALYHNQHYFYFHVDSVSITCYTTEVYLCKLTHCSFYIVVKWPYRQITGLKQIHSQLVNYWPITTNEMYIHVYLVVYGYLAVYSCVILGN